MADEIYINTGSNFQQPYQGQVTVNGQEPNIRNISGTYPANAQTPFTYQNRTPFTYRNPVNAQEPNIRNKQSPFTYQRTGQTPFTYRHPTTYQVSVRQPVIYQVQSPFTYRSPVNAQQPNNRQTQSPFTYQAPARQPVIYDHRSPFTYNHRSPFTANAQAIVQIPHIGSIATQGPHNSQAQSVEAIYEGELGGWISFRQPVPYIHQGPYITTYSFQANATPARSPFTSFNQNPSPYIYQSGQLFGLVTVNYPMYQIQTEQEYRYSLQNRSAQQPNPSIVNHQQPNIVLSNVGGARQPFIAQVQEPNIRNIQQPNIRNKQSPFTYPANAQEGNPYAYRSPFTYRNPVSAQENNAKNKQSPFTYPANAQTPSDAQQPYPYIANARQPVIYDHRSPFTYRNPVNAQQPYIANARQPSTYQNSYIFTYQHQSPFTYQTPYSTTRPIGPLAKVKGIFRNNNGSVEKVEQVYVNDSGTVEKIHQSVPNAQFSKGN